MNVFLFSGSSVHRGDVVVLNHGGGSIENGSTLLPLGFSKQDSDIRDLRAKTGVGIKRGAGVAAESSLHAGVSNNAKEKPQLAGVDVPLLSPAMVAEERQSKESSQPIHGQNLLSNIGNLLEEMDSLSTVENLGDKISFGEAASLPIGQLPTLADTVRCAKFHMKKQGLKRKKLTSNIGKDNCRF